LFCYVTASAVAKGQRVLLLVHREELLNQTSAALTRFEVAHGKIHPRYTPAYYERAQVASVQTIVNRLDKVPAPDLIVVDEAHHANAGSWQKILAAFPKARVLGVTATPCRADGRGLGEMFDAMVVGPSVADLIDMQFLVEPQVYAPSRPDLAGVGMVAGDYNGRQLANVMEGSTITGDAVAYYRKLADGLPAVVFCASVKHAELVAEEFSAAGYRAVSVDGNTDDETRASYLAGLGTGEIQVVASCNLISEGTDIPAIAAAILLRPTKSLSLYLQQVGRALRPFGDKSHAVILDHAGNCFEHGLPDEDREWSLEGYKKKKKAEEKKIGVKQCPKCYAMHKPILKECPACKHKYEVRSRELKTVDGELTRLEGNTDERRKNVRVAISEARTLDDLRRLQQEMGWSRGWAEIVYQKRQEAAARKKAEAAAKKK
jgi:superfamily II DNA or RNA helicase